MCRNELEVMCYSGCVVWFSDSPAVLMQCLSQWFNDISQYTVYCHGSSVYLLLCRTELDVMCLLHRLCRSSIASCCLSVLLLCLSGLSLPPTDTIIRSAAFWFIFIHSHSFISTTVDKTQLCYTAKIEWDGDRTENKVNVIYVWIIKF